MESNSAGDLAGAEAAGAHIDVLGRAVHHSLDALDVGLPGTVGTAVGVGPCSYTHLTPPPKREGFVVVCVRWL